MKTFAVESALIKESQLFFDMPGDAPETTSGITWVVREVAEMHLVAATAGMGTINAAATAQFLVDRFSPEALVFSGIAGSLNPRIGEGDVVVGKRLECLDSDMEIIAESAPGLTSFPSDATLVALAEAELTARNFEQVAAVAEAGGDASATEFGTLVSHAPRFCTGVVATSDLFSTEATVLADIRTRYQADCEEMEGVAAAQVAARAQIPFLAIRSISNVCGEAYTELDEREPDLEATARLAADITLATLKRYARHQ